MKTGAAQKPGDYSNTLETSAGFKFFGRLNDFLPQKRKNTRFHYAFKGNPSVKDAIEAIGVPHVEVALILANGRPVDFSYSVGRYDKIAVYPRVPAVGNKSTPPLKPPWPKKTQFILDSHLGKLARHLRLLGFDTLYRKNYSDKQIVDTVKTNRRIVLTRDVGLLKNKIIRWGYWVRATAPDRQIREVLKEFCLREKIKPFALCLECNGRIVHVAIGKIRKRLPPHTKDFFTKFYQCKGCKRIYWQGSHYERLAGFVAKLTKLR